MTQQTYKTLPGSAPDDIHYSVVSFDEFLPILNKCIGRGIVISNRSAEELYDEYVETPYHKLFHMGFVIRYQRYEFTRLIMEASALKWKMEQIKRAIEL